MADDNGTAAPSGFAPGCSPDCWIEIELRDEENNAISGLAGSVQGRSGPPRPVILRAGKNLIKGIPCGPVSLAFPRAGLLDKTMALPMRDEGVPSAVPDYAKMVRGYKNTHCSYRLVKYIDIQDPASLDGKALPPEQQLDLVTNQSYVLELRATRHEIIAVAGTQHKKESGNSLMFPGQAIRMLRKATGLPILPDNRQTPGEAAKRTPKGGLPPEACVCTLLFFTHEYTPAEKALVKAAVARINSGLARSGAPQAAPVLTLVELLSFDDFVKHFASGRDRSRFLVKQLNFYSHGVNGRISFGYKLDEGLDLTLANCARLPAYAFSPSARAESYACRTGMGEGVEEDDTPPDDKRERSIGQRLADQARIPVLAYVRKTKYHDTWGSDEDRHAYYRCPQAAWDENLKGRIKGGEKRDAAWCARYEQLDKERERNVGESGVAWNQDGASGDVRVSTDSYLNFTDEQITLRPR